MNFQDRLANVEDLVGESEEKLSNPTEDLICYYKEGQPPADQFFAACHSRMWGRYVRVIAVEINNYLNIHELEVHWLKQIN